MTTLAEAVQYGQGIERPFRCTEHDDTKASASVNVIKMVWHCYACMASGTVDGKKAPKVEALQSMLEPDKVPRIYPEAFLELYDTPVYWLSRFADWTAWTFRLGQDPFTDDATFPVRTPNGLLAGVGRRKEDPGDGPRYVYPKAWSASRSMFGMAVMSEVPHARIITLVEGAADAAACWEVGIPALACYGAGLHHPQQELLMRLNPKAILAGFDRDDAGDRATDRVLKDLSSMLPVARVHWSKKDPGDTPPEWRTEAALRCVGHLGYSADQVESEWAANLGALTARYDRYLVEEDR